MRQSSILACVPSKGFVRACPSGCVHVSYCGVSLDFTTPCFESFAQTLERNHAHLQESDVELNCFHATLRFAWREYAEFSGLVAEGKRRLTLWQNQQADAKKDPLPHLPKQLAVRDDVFSQN